MDDQCRLRILLLADHFKLRSNNLVLTWSIYTALPVPTALPAMTMLLYTHRNAVDIAREIRTTRPLIILVTLPTQILLHNAKPFSVMSHTHERHGPYNPRCEMQTLIAQPVMQIRLIENASLCGLRPAPFIAVINAIVALAWRSCAPKRSAPSELMIQSSRV